MASARGSPSLVGTGHGPGRPARVAAAGAVGANVVNNLPAYLALEPVAAGAPARLMALLVGVDVGPLVTPWASLATLLWLQRCRGGRSRSSPVARLARPAVRRPRPSGGRNARLAPAAEPVPRAGRLSQGAAAQRPVEVRDEVGGVLEPDRDAAPCRR